MGIPVFTEVEAQSLIRHQLVNNQLEPALRLAKQATADYSTNALLWWLRANVESTLNLPAKDSFAQVLELAQDFHLARFQLALLAWQEGGEQAAAQFSELATNGEPAFIKEYAAAFAALLEGDIEGAQQLFARAQANNPIYTELNSALSKVPEFSSSVDSAKQGAPSLSVPSSSETDSKLPGAAAERDTKDEAVNAAVISLNKYFDE